MKQTPLKIMSGRLRSSDGGVLVPLLSVLVALGIGVSAYAIVRQQQEQRMRIATERELMSALSEKDDLQEQLQDVTSAKMDVEQKLKRAEARALQVASELETALMAQASLREAVEARQQEIDRIAADLEQVRNERIQMVDDMGDFRFERVELQREVEDLRSAKAELEAKVMEMADQPMVELGRVVVSDLPARGGDFASQFVTPISLSTGGGSTEGQVVVVNREYEFVVMNVGREQGIVIGQAFEILRGSNVVGMVEVEKIYDELSAAAILPESDADLIREGDIVRAL